MTDFNARNKILTDKLFHQGYRYHKLRKTFSKFYRRHYELVSKFKVELKSLLQYGLSGISRVCCLVIRGSTGDFPLLRYFSGIVSQPGGSPGVTIRFSLVYISDSS